MNDAEQGAADSRRAFARDAAIDAAIAAREARVEPIAGPSSEPLLKDKKAPASMNSLPEAPLKLKDQTTMKETMKANLTARLSEELPPALSEDTRPSRIPVVTLERILPTRVWIEDDLFGSRHVMLQHEGMDAFCYASFYYGYAYTSNTGTFAAATELALSLGATEPIERTTRPFPVESPKG